jgi:hypothetical protein
LLETVRSRSRQKGADRVVTHQAGLMEVAFVALVVHVAVATVQVAATRNLENVASDRHCCAMAFATKAIQRTLTLGLGGH